MPDVYRFRSIHQLLDKRYQELERQSIHFARPDHLNDPMEGFRDIVWAGDEIVWANLFKHYIFCLHQTCMLVTAVGDSIQLEAKHIPTKGHWDEPPTRQAATVFDEVWREASSKLQLADLVQNITNMKHEVRHDELLLFLDDIHIRAVELIQEIHVKHGLAPDVGPTPTDRRESILSNTNYFDHIRKIEVNGGDINTTISLLISKMMMWQQLAQSYYLRETPPTILERNLRLLYFQFANMYMEQIEQLLWPPWYTACFAKSYHNSSMWANYSDGHRGVCMVFEVTGSASKYALELRQPPGNKLDISDQQIGSWQTKSMQFRDVTYTNAPERIDFFGNIGRLPVPALMNQWYTNENGHVSNCAAHITSDASQTHWQNAYWDRFERYITTKSKDWSYERECRLLLYGILKDFQDEQQRTFSYDFKTLKGIIFGLRTSNEDKLKIINILHKKCRANDISEFKLYDAYYSPVHGDIRRREIRLKFDEPG